MEEKILGREEKIVHLTEKTLEKIGFQPKEFKDYNQYLQAIRRINGIKFTIDDYVEALVFSQLSFRRKWKKIDELRDDISEIFEGFNFKKVKILAKNSTKLTNDIRSIGAGNFYIKKQMKGLAKNLVVLEKLYNYIENDYNKDVEIKLLHKYTIEYVKKIANSKNGYKLSYVGPALAAEFLKNIGIPVAKPDVHILRILGKNRLGILSIDHESPSNKEKIELLTEFYSFVQKITTNAAEVIYYDSLFWYLGADGYGEICTKEPRCEICLLSNLCNFNK